MKGAKHGILVAVVMSVVTPAPPAAVPTVSDRPGR